MSNQAAWLPSKGARFEVKEAPFTTPGPEEVLIRNHVMAINPFDCMGGHLETYPFILGLEVAGEIEEVGEEVTRFKKGDRVVGFALATRTNNLAHAGFQLFTVCGSTGTAHIPPGISYANAVVLPIGFATAAAGLYEPKYLGYPVPGQSSSDTSGEKKSILIWGGSSVVGSCAIQLAAASGLIVITTASAKNHEYVRSLGATHVFDYSDEDVVVKILKAVNGTTLVGAYDVISVSDSTEKSAEIVHACGGGKLLATTLRHSAETLLFGDVVRTFVFVPSPTLGQEPPVVWLGVWREFFEEGLIDGRLKAKPEPIVIEGGLEKVQEAVDVLKKGISAAKVVVKL